MRFLNKVVFINSATIRYAEVMLDGNVHLIGTQGVGKSTLLRAVLFFYNADTLKLGISKEKKNFAEYYFPYQNSFLIYEVMRETGPFCIVAFKSQGKVCFRFLDSGYNREHFVSADGRAFEKWEDNRQVLDAAHIDYTRKIDRYEEYRDIVYGNIEGGKKEFSKYTLLQSRQYQNIPRTIQNVFLNSKLEAEFIKQTIIMSLNEEDITIDLQSYTHHLKNFEHQLNDIQLYQQPHIQKQAENVVKNHLAIKHLESEKNRFALQLAWSAAQVSRNIPKLVDKKEKAEAEKAALQEKAENTASRFLSKSDRIKAEISVLESDIKKAKEKADYYNRQQIETIIERVGKKNTYEAEQQKLQKEKQLLTTQFSEVTLKYEGLLQALTQSGRAFEQDNKEQQVAHREQAGNEKEALRHWLDKALHEVRVYQQQAIQQAQLSVQQQQDNLHQEKIKKAGIQHQRFFETELTDARNTVSQYQVSIQQNLLELEHLKNRGETLQKQWELDDASTKQKTEREQEKLQAAVAELQQQSQAINEKLKNSGSALYGWLNQHKPGWEATIGKVTDEQVLFHTELSPRLAKNTENFYGIELDLADMPVQVKTLEEYQEELARINKETEQYEKQLKNLQSQLQQQLEKLKKKYQPLVKETRDSLLEKQYKQEQDTLQLQQAQLQQKDWEVKAKEAKQQALASVEAAIAAASEALAAAQQNLQRTEEELAKQIKSKEREHGKKVAVIEQQLAQQIARLQEDVKTYRQSWQQQEQDLKQRQQEELSGKGADIKRIDAVDKNLQSIKTELAFIEEKRDLVAEYKKDKKELIDRADEFKSRKATLDQQHHLEEEKYQLQKEAIQTNIKEVDEKLLQLQQQLAEAEDNAKAFARFQQTEAWQGIHSAYTEEKDIHKNDKSCTLLIEEINRCYYTAITRLDNLKEAANKFLGNFSAQNIFKFPESLTEKYAYQQFAEELNEFINNSKIEEYEKRVNERFANVIKLVGKETSDLMSKAGDIQKVITNINKDFDSKNFVGAIRKIELRIHDSANGVVQLLLRIKKFNDDHSFDIGGLNLFSSVDKAGNDKIAVDLLKQLSKAIAEYRKDVIALSDSFELQFRVEENQNDTGWVEKLSNVGSEGTDVLVKAMINIMLLNVFKEGASKRFREFRLHCMMDEIGKLHPNNIKGILQFANDRNILLINGSPTETNALNYRHIYKLEKDNNRNTKIKRIITNYSQS
ncbi:ATP-binding protein [Foetidibacter luteolus]|uniref:ATP-binding protein n=1 Tax=Foetidibacter luteolus TaxID=2608880 RepID=UPI00129B9987|nr:ATP-binding protein [Foetidibacter luteolus]